MFKSTNVALPSFQVRSSSWSMRRTKVRNFLGVRKPIARVMYCPPFHHLDLTVSTMTFEASVPFHPYNVGKVFANGSKTLLFS